MITNEEVIFIDETKRYNPQKEALYKGCKKAIKIKYKNIFLVYFLELLKSLGISMKNRPLANINIKIIIIADIKHEKFAIYLQKKFFNSAKIIQFYTRGSIVKNAPNIIASNLIKIPKKFHLKSIFYSGILMNQETPIYNIMPIVNHIEQPIVWIYIDNYNNVFSQKSVEQFCDIVIKFAKDFNCFVFIAIKIKSSELYNKIKQKISTQASCYIFDLNEPKNMDYYYSFLYKAKYLFHFGIKPEKIIFLANLKKILYVFASNKECQKNILFFRDMVNKNVILFEQQVHISQQTSLPINDISVLWKKIYATIDQDI